jgi:hypothetical protein
MALDVSATVSTLGSSDWTSGGQNTAQPDRRPDSTTALMQRAASVLSVSIFIQSADIYMT